MHLLSEAAVVPQGQNGISATETTCPSNARIFYCLIMYRKELSVKKKSYYPYFQIFYKAQNDGDSRE